MRREGGFTLLEVLVAFIIAALALAALFEGGLGGLGASAASSRTLEAVARARSHLAAASLPDPLVASDTQGDEGAGYHWHVRVTQLAAGVPGQRAGAGPLPALFAISAAITWTEGGRARALQIDSARAATAPPRAP